MLHALFDFGLYIPANMLSFAVLCGAVAGRAAQLAAQSRPSVGLALPRLGWVPLALAAALVAVSAWGFFELRGTAAVQQAVDDVKSRRFDEERPSGATAAELEAAIKRLSAAVANREDDAEGHSQLGILWTHLYHVRAFEKLRQSSPTACCTRQPAGNKRRSRSSTAGHTSLCGLGSRRPFRFFAPSRRSSRTFSRR